jgi:hypothetical protein
MKFETSEDCFLHGKTDPNGLQLSFDIDKERKILKLTFIASLTFQGRDSIVHGGNYQYLIG